MGTEIKHDRVLILNSERLKDLVQRDISSGTLNITIIIFRRTYNTLVFIARRFKYKGGEILRQLYRTNIWNYVCKSSYPTLWNYILAVDEVRHN